MEFVYFEKKPKRSPVLVAVFRIDYNVCCFVFITTALLVLFDFDKILIVNHGK